MGTNRKFARQSVTIVSGGSCIVLYLSKTVVLSAGGCEGWEFGHPPRWTLRAIVASAFDLFPIVIDDSLALLGHLFGARRERRDRLSSRRGDRGVVVVILHNGGHKSRALDNKLWRHYDWPVHRIIIERVAIWESKESCNFETFILSVHILYKKIWIKNIQFI